MGKDNQTLLFICGLRIGFSPGTVGEEMQEVWKMFTDCLSVHAVILDFRCWLQKRY